MIVTKEQFTLYTESFLLKIKLERTTCQLVKVHQLSECFMVLHKNQVALSLLLKTVPFIWNVSSYLCNSRWKLIAGIAKCWETVLSMDGNSNLDNTLDAERFHYLCMPSSTKTCVCSMQSTERLLQADEQKFTLWAKKEDKSCSICSKHTLFGLDFGDFLMNNYTIVTQMPNWLIIVW